MSNNWTEVVVEQLDGKELDVAVVQAVLERHAEMDWYDGDHPDWVNEIIDRSKDWNDPTRYLPNKAAVRGTQWGKYMVDADWAKVSRKLTKKLGRVRLTVVEEWTADEPGQSRNVYVAGQHLPAESATAMLVNDLVRDLIDVDAVPEVLTWDQIDAVRKFDPRQQFILVPIKPDAEPWCNHDPVAVVDGRCECGEVVAA